MRILRGRERQARREHAVGVEAWIDVLELLASHAYALYLPAGSVAMEVSSHINRIATPSFIFFGISVVFVPEGNVPTVPDLMPWVRLKD